MPKAKKKVTVRSNYEAQRWCFNNGYKIYVVPDGKQFKVEIKLGNKVKRSQGAFNKSEIEQKIWDTYEYYYEQGK